MDDRRIFNHVHEELSVLVGKLIPRMDLWAEFDGWPPTKEIVISFLRERAAQVFPEIPERKLRRLCKRFERRDPDQDTPAEIFARICGGRKDKQNG